MTAARWQERGITPQEAAILSHPDQHTPWAPSLVVHLATALAEGAVAERLAALAAAHPILDARLAGTRWLAGSGRLHLEAVDDPLPVLRSRFALSAGPPVRVARTSDGARLVIVGHHAALDGRALVEIAAALLGAAEPRDRVTTESESEAPTPPPSAAATTAGAAEALRRLRRPADRVAASSAPPASESFVAGPIPDGAPVRASALAAAATAAAASWNAEHGAAWSRIGLTIPVGGTPVVIGNISTHRRVDLTLPADVATAVGAALAQAAAPPGSGISPARARVLKLLAPVVDRLSDSLLVSNLGRIALPGARAVDFYPQARGRSAVAIGAATPIGGDARLTLRARDLTAPDAHELLRRIVAALVAQPG